MTQRHRLCLPASGLLAAGLVISIVSSSLVGFTSLAQATIDSPTPAASATPTAVPKSTAVTPAPLVSVTSTPLPPSDTPVPTEASTSTPSTDSTETATCTATALPSSTASATPTAASTVTATITESAAPSRDINISLEGTISAHGFFLLERTDDATVSNIDADQIYAGGLNNNGENLRLRDPAGTLIDSANYPGGWPAGEAGGRISMERRGGEDLPGNWGSYSGTGGWGRDAAFNPIYGTPRQTNSFFLPTATPTPTASEYPTTESTPLAAGSVLINEIAWSGTAASSSDEWIELHNPGPEAIDLSGWTLSDGGDVHISLAGEIASFGFFLLERTDDNCVSDIAAQQIYSGNLNNSGERLFLYDAAGRTIDSANGDGGGWPAGDSASHRSMERRGGTDRFGNWGTFTGYYGRGRDAAGGPIAGTPGTTNSLFYPTPVPTWIPGKVVINEVLIRPHYDWEGKEGRSLEDEFIELYNVGPHGVDLGGFMLDDIADGGSKPYTLPDVRIPPGAFAVFFRSQTRIALNDTGDEVRLLSPGGRLLDSISYLKVRAYNLSYGRLPDGSGHLYYGLWPTPGEANVFFIENEKVTHADLTGLIYEMRLVRLSRSPAMVWRMNLLGHVFQVQLGDDSSP
ncbi:MAG: lamin tail domain-containing protein [Anaerolineales bacterium]